MFHEKISLNLVLRLLLLNFVSEFRLELMHISLIVNSRLSLTHLNGYQLLVRLAIAHIEVTFFVCTDRINLLNVKSF